MPSGPAPLPRERLRPTTRYRYGSRATGDRVHHAEQSRAWRRALTDSAFDACTRTLFLAALRSLGDPKAAAERVGVSLGLVYGRMRWDNAFSARVEDVLTGLCGGEHCGTVRGYREGGRCARCRAAKARDRGPRRAE